MNKIKKQRKNKYPQSPQAVCDLHGLTKAEARESINIFLEHAKKNNLSIVRIITGKGLHSVSGGVLKNFTENYLSEKGYEYKNSKISQGGEGALDIKL